MNCEVEPDEFRKRGVVSTTPEHLREVVSPVLRTVDGADARAGLVRVAVDGSRNRSQFRDQVHRVLITILRKKTPVTCRPDCQS